MLLSRRYLTIAALALLLLGSSANAAVPFFGRPVYPQGPQVYSPPVQPNPMIAPGVFLKQYAYNTAVLGQAASQIPPYMLGYNPYPQVAYSGGPALPLGVGGVSPYALSTQASYNPYLGGAGSLDNSPYSLSTGGGSYGSGYNPYSNPYNPNYGGYSPVGSELQGAAALTSAAGQYYMSTQKASQMREQTRSMAMENARRRVELERWYESTRPTTNQVRDKEVAAELEHVRKDASDVEVASAKALNVLLRSIQKASNQLKNGPNIPLDDDTLKHINLAGTGASGNVGMLKDVSNLTWPEGLQDSGYDEARKRLTRNLVQAVTILKDKDPVPANTLKDIRADYKSLNDKLNEAADDMPPSQYIEARRFLNQLNQAVRALADPNVVKYFNNTWTPQGKNVAELVAHLSKAGLSFAPAAPGDESAYKALYLAMRQFETGLETAQR